MLQSNIPGWQRNDRRPQVRAGWAGNTLLVRHRRGAEPPGHPRSAAMLSGSAIVVTELDTVLSAHGLACGRRLRALAGVIVQMLEYDRALKVRAEKAVVVGIVAKASDRASIDAQVAMQRAFDAIASQDVRGLPLRAVSLSFKTPAEVGAWIAQEGVAMR